MIRRRGLALGVASFVLLLASACGGSDPTPTPAEATSTPVSSSPGAEPATPTAGPPTFEEEWETLKAAAREEGKLVLLVGNRTPLGPPIREGFGEQFGIEVTLSGASGSQHAPRVAAEREAGKYEVDAVILGRSTVGPRLAEPGFMTPIDDQLFHPDALDLSKWWGNRFWYREPEGVEPKYTIAFAVKALKNPIDPSYNSDLVTEADLADINSVWDFLDDKWRGKIIAMSPLETGASGTITAVYRHPEMGPEWLARFYATAFEVTFVGDVRSIVDSLGKGGHSFSLFDQGASTAFELLLLEGVPVHPWDKNLKEGGVMKTTSPTWLGMMDRAPHPNAAKLFLNWWLTQEGQTAYHTLASTPPPPSLREDVPQGATLDIERRDPGAVYDMSDIDTSLPDLRADAIEFAQRTFLER